MKISGGAGVHLRSGGGAGISAIQREPAPTLCDCHRGEETQGEKSQFILNIGYVL